MVGAELDALRGGAEAGGVRRGVGEGGVRERESAGDKEVHGEWFEASSEKETRVVVRSR